MPARGQTRHLLLLLLGLGLTLAAIALLLLRSDPGEGERVVSGLIGALAGGLIGASVSNLVNEQYGQPVLDEIQSLLAQTSASAVTSPESSLQHFRKRWHHYHRTMIDGNPTWRYAQVPFDNHSAVGALTAEVPVIDVNGDRPPHMYKTNAAVWDRRLIILQTRVEGEEAALVEIFPNVAAVQKVHAGVAVMQSWSGNDVLSPTLISSSPLLEAQEEGSIVDSDRAQKLAELWNTHFAAVQRLLPDDKVAL